MKQTRLYSLFEMQGGKMVRVSLLSFRKDVAVRFFQDRLLSAFFNGRRASLRVVKL